jgi:hypothetical protein
MDVLNVNTIPNPSGLDAQVTGSPQLVDGVVYKALRIDGARQKIKVSGPGHRNECFGDLTLCPEGKDNFLKCIIFGKTISYLKNERNMAHIQY